MRHGRALGWEVGEWLWFNFFECDEQAMRSLDSGKDRALYDVAAGSGVPYRTLYDWVRAAMVRRTLPGFEDDLSMSHMSALAALIDYPKEARALAAWAISRHIGCIELRPIASQWRAHLDEGGSFDELARELRKRPLKVLKPGRKPFKRSLGSDLVLPRLLEIAGRWAAEAKIAPALCAELLADLAKLRALATGGKARPRPPEPDEPGPGPDDPPHPGPDATVVARAVQFIRQRLRAHELDFALEVGKHLFENIYDSDPRLFKHGKALVENTIACIACDPRVEMEVHQLYECIRTYLTVSRFGKDAPAVALPGLPVWQWAKLAAFRDEPGAVVPVALWAAHERADQQLVVSVANLVKPFTAAGGKLDDLLPPWEPGAKPRPRRVDTPYRRIDRIVGMALKHVQARGLAVTVRPRTLAAIDVLEARLTADTAVLLRPLPRKAGSR